MGIEAYEATIELEIGSLEAESPRSTGGSAFRSAYPYPVLKPTGQLQRTEFRSLVLESSLLRATVVPALGGRLVGLLDKRTGVEIFDASRLVPEVGGARGAHLRHGIQFRVGPMDRPNSLGPVEAELQEGPVGTRIACAEIVAPLGLSCQWYFGLEEERAELLLGFRSFNRNLGSRACAGGIAIDLDADSAEVVPGLAAFCPTRDVGLAVWTEGDPFGSRGFDDGTLFVGRSLGARLEGRASDAWTVRVTPWSGLGGFGAVSRSGALRIGGSKLFFQAAVALPSGRVEMVGGSGNQVAAGIDAMPESILEVDLPEEPTRLALLDAAGNVAIVWPQPIDPELRDNAGLAALREVRADDSEAFLRRASLPMATRYLAHTALGIRALRRTDWDGAETEMDAALTYNGDDPLAWWSKAMVARLRADAEPDPGPMLNAHFVAPFEPALRAEAFLAQTGIRSPLVAAMKDRPDEMVEVACLLLDFGLFGEATRWIDEALRHIDFPMLRYLTGYAYLAGSKLDAEAAAQVVAAAKLGVVPPFPWREMEIEALARLSEAFPADPTLAEFVGLSQFALPSPA